MTRVIPRTRRLVWWVEIRAHLPGGEPPLLLLRVPHWDYN